MLKQLDFEARKCLDCFQQEIKQLLKDKLYGMYLYGSIALGAFEKGKSDIDFIILLNDSLTEHEELALAQLHQRLQENFPEVAKRLDGLYLYAAHAGLTNAELFPYPYVTEGELHLAGHWDINHVTWWILKNKGIALAGPAVSELPYIVLEDQLLDTMHYNIHVYWKRYLERLKSKVNQHLKSVLTEELAAEFADAVLTLSRIYYTIQEKGIVSKKEAGKWLIARLDEQSLKTAEQYSMRQTIEKALNIRQGLSSDSMTTQVAIHAIEQLVKACQVKLHEHGS